MSKNMTKASNGPRQNDNVIRGLPFGIYCEKLMRGSTYSETVSICASYHILRKRGVFERVSVANKGKLKRVNRDILAADQLRAVLQDVCPENILAEIPNDKKITVRGDEYHMDVFQRLIRNADVQNFLYSCGVETPYTVLTKYHADPFIFGLPVRDDDGQSNADRISLCSALTRAMYAVTQKEAMPSVREVKEVKAVYYANRFNKYTQRINVTGKSTVSRAFNNSLGMLIDFANLCGYMIFKFFDAEKEMTWRARAYGSIMDNCEAATRRLGIRNLIFGTSDFNTAIILCETESEYNAVIKKGTNIAELGKCFTYILPIRMNEDGIREIKALLSMGIQNYIQSYDDKMLKAIEPTSLELHRSGITYFGENGDTYYNGTYVNIVDLNRIKKDQETVSDWDQDKHLICRESQKDLYCNVAGIDSEYLITI